MTTNTRQSMDFFRPTKSPAKKKPIPTVSSGQTVIFATKKSPSAGLKSRVEHPSPKLMRTNSMVASIPTKSVSPKPTPKSLSPSSSTNRAKPATPKSVSPKPATKPKSPTQTAFLESVTVEKRPLGSLSSPAKSPSSKESPEDDPRRLRSPDPVRKPSDLSEKKPLSTVFIIFLTIVLGVATGIAVYYFISRA